jgi:hypothetical protein
MSIRVTAGRRGDATPDKSKLLYVEEGPTRRTTGRAERAMK